MPNLKVTQQQSADTGLAITLEGAVNPDLAAHLQFGGCDYNYSADGAVQIVLKLRCNNARKPGTSTSSSRDTGGEGKDLHASEGSSRDNQQDARQEDVEPSQKKEKVQVIRTHSRKKKL